MSIPYEIAIDPVFQANEILREEARRTELLFMLTLLQIRNLPETKEEA